MNRQKGVLKGPFTCEMGLVCALVWLSPTPAVCRIFLINYFLTIRAGVLGRQRGRASAQRICKCARACEPRDCPVCACTSDLLSLLAEWERLLKKHLITIAQSSIKGV